MTNYERIAGTVEKDTTFVHKNYSEISPVNAIIYCDPPYQGVKQYLNSGNFNYDLFWDTIREWDKNNIVLISELNAPNDFNCIWEQEVLRSIKAVDKSKSIEKLFI